MINSALASGEGLIYTFELADKPLTRIASSNAIRPLPSGEK
jgi:hypothetical protein